MSLFFCRLIRQLRGGKIVHVIGDSHTLAFQHCALKVHYLGAVTAYNLIYENSSSMGREKLFKVVNSLKEGETIMLVFGEIDARIHIYNQYMKRGKKISIEKLVSNVIRNYGQVIEEIKKRGFKIGVYNIVPPGPQSNIYNYPYYADWETHLRITQIMNKQVKNFCMRNEFFFVDIFNQVINAEMLIKESFRKSEYIFDDVHLNDKITKLVIEDLKSMSII